MLIQEELQQVGWLAVVPQQVWPNSRRPLALTSTTTVAITGLELGGTHTQTQPLAEQDDVLVWTGQGAKCAGCPGALRLPDSKS